MKNVLIINGAKDYAHSKGALNNSLVKVATDVLVENGINVKTTYIDKGYSLVEEVEKFVWADTIIYQLPVWWMGTPWTVKKYIDDVFMEASGKLWLNDGRVIDDSTKKYGSGGLSHNKKFMLSVTWNAPLESFVEPNQFFEGKGVDGVFFPMYKANEFLGMKRLPTFMCNDVMKNTNFDKYVKDYTDHLNKYLID